MINPRHLRDHVIIPVLNHLGPAYSRPEAINLLLGTCAQESAMGLYLVQLGRGPAKGIYQMEPATHDDLRKNYLAHRPELRDLVDSFRSAKPRALHEQLVGNLNYATAMARIHYWRKPGAIPTTLEGQAATWKRDYNTHLGRGTPEEYIRNWERYVAPNL